MAIALLPVLTLISRISSHKKLIDLGVKTWLYHVIVTLMHARIRSVLIMQKSQRVLLHVLNVKRRVCLTQSVKAAEAMATVLC
jgi:CMP-2-keto-3-deoxyoctulosonic acid synthetase